MHSHLVSVPPGPHVLADALTCSPILQGEGGAGESMDAEFGVDPNVDPELALVCGGIIRILSFVWVHSAPRATALRCSWLSSLADLRRALANVSGCPSRLWARLPSVWVHAAPLCCF